MAAAHLPLAVIVSEQLAAGRENGVLILFASNENRLQNMKEEGAAAMDRNVE